MIERREAVNAVKNMLDGMTETERESYFNRLGFKEEDSETTLRKKRAFPARTRTAARLYKPVKVGNRQAAK